MLNQNVVTCNCLQIKHRLSITWLVLIRRLVIEKESHPIIKMSCDNFVPILIYTRCCGDNEQRITVYQDVHVEKKKKKREEKANC